jgi:hypothetical protein
MFTKEINQSKSVVQTVFLNETKTKPRTNRTGSVPIRAEVTGISPVYFL